MVSNFSSDIKVCAKCGTGYDLSLLVLCHLVHCFMIYFGCHRYFLTAYTSLQDGEAYTFLLNILAPQTCSLSPLEVKDPLERAKAVLNQADQIGCRRTPKDIVEGSTNLNLAFVANLFHERCLYCVVVINAIYLTDFTEK